MLSSSCLSRRLRDDPIEGVKEVIRDRYAAYFYIVASRRVGIVVFAINIS